jgi:hypothetical protein
MHPSLIFATLVVPRQKKKNIVKSMNIRRPLAMFDPVGWGTLLVCVPDWVTEALFRDSLGGLTF